METENNNNKANAQSGQPKQWPQGFDLSGLDLSGVLPPGTWEAVKPFLSSGVMAGGLYLFLIKPLKDQVEAQEKTLEEMEERLDSQKDYILKLEERLDGMQKDLGSINDEMERKSGLFETKRRSSHSSGSTSSGAGDYRKRSLNL